MGQKTATTFENLNNCQMQHRQLVFLCCFGQEPELSRSIHLSPVVSSCSETQFYFSTAFICFTGAKSATFIKPNMSAADDHIISSTRSRRLAVQTEKKKDKKRRWTTGWTSKNNMSRMQLQRSDTTTQCLCESVLDELSSGLYWQVVDGRPRVT